MNTQIDLTKEYYYSNGGIIFVTLLLTTFLSCYQIENVTLADVLIAFYICSMVLVTFRQIKYLLLILFVIMSLYILLMKLVFYYMELDNQKNANELRIIYSYSQIGFVITLIIGVIIFVENEMSKNYYKTYEKM